MSLFLQLYLIKFIVYIDVHAQTTSLYIPSVSDSGGLNLGVSLMASIVDTGGGATVYQIFLGTSEDQADNGPDSTCK